MKRILYLGWLGFNNIGDELMWEIFNDLCSEYLDLSKYEIIPSNFCVNIKDTAQYDIIILGGGSLFLPGFIEILHECIKQGKQVLIWGSGYDWADKSYIKIIEDAKIPSYLFNDNTEMLLINLVNKVSYIGVRGPLTYALLKSVNVNINKVEISGDPGLLIKSKIIPDFSPVLEWKDNEKIIGINWGTSENRIYGQNESDLEDQLACTCKTLLKQGYKIYMFVLWGRDVEASKRLYNKIDCYTDIILDTNIYAGGELLSILKQFSFSINFKLHANVLSTVAEIPFVCLAYRFKCFDYVKSLDLEDLIVATDSNSIQQDILKTIAYIVSNEVMIKQKLVSYMSLYKQRLMTPFLNSLIK
ncbi:MAG: polysaccharide pyruvyl transferase family protein [Clostridiaceae bacterium]|nr:polysaccharide pyruvyl transferase family protein [Clostridiaceae bacterium]